MFTVCKTCSNSYHIPDEILGDRPRQFRCSGCGRCWALRPRATLAASPAVARGAPSRFAGSPARGFLGRLARASRRLVGPLAAVAALAGSMAALGAREAIVAAVPSTAGAYAAIGLPVNLRGLAIEGVHAEVAGAGDRRVLLVEGDLVNLRAGETVAPGLRVALLGSDGRELYVWTARAPKPRLAAGERAPFAARLASPPEGVVEALVKFVARGDKVAPSPEGS